MAAAVATAAMTATAVAATAVAATPMATSQGCARHHHQNPDPDAY
jgi:hypothetical protein